VRGRTKAPLVVAVLAAVAVVIAGCSLVGSPRAHARIDPPQIDISQLTLSATGSLSGALYNGTDVTVGTVTLEIRVTGILGPETTVQNRCDVPQRHPYGALPSGPRRHRLANVPSHSTCGEPIA
jgi:hypothetical protein